MYLKRIFVCCFCVVLLLCGCNGKNPLYELFKSQGDKVLDDGRPENATNLPDFSGEIEDIRITTVPRDVDLSGYRDIIGKGWYFRQIYYGYSIEGNWTDLPCENYQLVSILNSTDYYTGEEKVAYGYDAANEDHMVRIGKYLLISLIANKGSEEYYGVSDSMNNEFQLMFQEFFESAKKQTKFGYLREDRDSVVSGWHVEYAATTLFNARYYLWLEYDKIPQDYELEKYYIKDDTQYTYVLTYEDIQQLLGESS